MFIGLTKIEKEQLKYEVISNNARLGMTRLIRAMCKSDDSNIQLLRQNRFVNIGKNVLGKPLYILEPDDMGGYYPAEHAWHLGGIEILLRRPNTLQLVEILADILQENHVDIYTINQILIEDGVSINFEEDSNGNVNVGILSIEDIDEV